MRLNTDLENTNLDFFEKKRDRLLNKLAIARDEYTILEIASPEYWECESIVKAECEILKAEIEIVNTKIVNTKIENFMATSKI